MIRYGTSDYIGNQSKSSDKSQGDMSQDSHAVIVLIDNFMVYRK